MDELLDLVDLNDVVIDKMWRSEVHKRKLSNFRVINAFLKNGKGEIWIPLRTASKKLFPLHLDVSVGGHVSSGEDYETSFIRELSEELNIDASTVSYKQVGYFTPHKNGVSAFQTIFEIDYEQDPNFNPDDFIEGKWFLPECILNIILSGQRAKGDLPKLLKLIYLN